MQRGSLVRGGKDLPVGSKPVRLHWAQAEPDDTYERLSGSLVGNPSALVGMGWKPPLASPADSPGERGVKKLSAECGTRRREGARRETRRPEAKAAAARHPHQQGECGSLRDQRAVEQIKASGAASLPP